MKIMCVAQVEDRTNLNKQVLKQTKQPDRTIFWIDSNPEKGIDRRRRRISENHSKLRELVEAYEPDLVWQIEGDCELPRNCLEILIEDYKRLSDSDPKLAYVSGIQVGRHGLYCLGAWRFENDEVYSLDYRSKGFQKVDATGFYCLLADRERWLEGVADWSPKDKFGPDVNFGRSLTEKGYSIYCDMDLEIGHIHNNGIIWPHHISTCNAKFFYDDNGKWDYKQLD